MSTKACHQLFDGMEVLFSIHFSYLSRPLIRPLNNLVVMSEGYYSSFDPHALADGKRSPGWTGSGSQNSVSSEAEHGAEKESKPANSTGENSAYV
jgi:hypothetical protein